MDNSLLKFFLFIIIVCFAGISSMAQIKKPGLLLGGNLVYNMPKGNFANDYKNGVGAEVSAGLGYGKTYLVGTMGYMYLMDRGTSNTSNTTYKPFKIGIRRYLIGKNLFINADVGKFSIISKDKNTKPSTYTHGFGAGIRLLGIEAALYRDSWKNPNLPGFSNSLQYKLGWNFTL